jgi:hypothetical protein
MLYKFVLPTILCFSVAPLGFTYLMGFVNKIDDKISDLSLMLYVVTYMNFFLLVLFYQMKKRYYKLDLEIQSLMSEDDFTENVSIIFVLLFGSFATLLLLSLINYNINYNSTSNIIFCIYGFICAFIIILDNTYRSYVMIKEKIY